MSTAPVGFTAAQLEDQVRNLLSDNINFIPTAPDSLSPQTWSTQQVYDALNFAIKMYCRSTRATYTESDVDVDASGEAIVPTNYLMLDHVFWPANATGGFGVFGSFGGD
jgi:hypothetical protein